MPARADADFRNGPSGRTFFVAGIAGLIAKNAPRLLPIDRRAFAAQQHVNAAIPYARRADVLDPVFKVGRRDLY
jgi:hypothetical protein